MRRWELISGPKSAGRDPEAMIVCSVFSTISEPSLWKMARVFESKKPARPWI